MERNRKTVIAVVLLLVWAVGATVAFIAENVRSLELVNESVRVEASYNRLREKYAELEEESDELENKYMLHLAYEWLFDVIANKANDTKKAQASLDDIAEREGLTLAEKNKVASYSQKILSKYGIKAE